MDRTTDHNSRFVLSESLALLATPKLDEGGSESLALGEVERILVLTLQLFNHLTL
jgi:hypothetical protein